MIFSLESYRKQAIKAIKEVYEGLTCRHRIQLIEDCKNIFEISNTMSSWFTDWDLNFVKSRAILHLSHSFVHDIISAQELEKELKMVDFTEDSWIIFKIMSKYEGWDFTFKALKQRAEWDLDGYIEKFEEDGEEYALESPIWREELADCKTSLEVIKYMQEFGWSGKCICDEAKYLSYLCAYCEEQMSHLHEIK